MQFFSSFLFVLLIYFGICSSLGIDHSQPISVSQFSCLLQSNQTFAYIRAWRSFGAFDNNAPLTISNALSAGYSLSNVGVYMFPCFNLVDAAKSPEKQVRDMLELLDQKQTKYSSIWLDMETNPSVGCGWGTNYPQNCEFTQRLVQAAKKSNKTVGIYASYYMWNQIMGGVDRCSKFMDLPLWYAHYDGILNFTDFKSFGGWSSPAIKQYKGSSILCGVNGLDLNYRQ